MKKGLLFILIFTISMFDMPVHASAQEKVGQNLISTIYINNELTENVLKEIKEYLNNYMKQKLSMYNTSIINEDIYKIPKYNYKNKKVMGLTNYVDSEIIVHNDYDSVNRKRILLHELGHVIDSWDSLDNYGYRLPGKYSETTEFQNIFKSECSSLKKYSCEYYFETDIKEFFAESFSIYIMKPEIIKDNAPMMFKYMEGISQQKTMSGWQLNKNNKWYYLENNKYKIGWFKDKNDKWYYFSLSGEMMTNVTVDGYSIGSDGVMVLG